MKLIQGDICTDNRTEKEKTYTKGKGKLRMRSCAQMKDWVGKQFGDLTVCAYDGKRGGKHYWRCRCICGRETSVCQSNLKSGHTRSCGCLVNPVITRHFVEGTCIESIRSRKVFTNNTSGARGVYKNKRTGRWTAQITFQGKTRYLGSYIEFEEAVKARNLAEEVFNQFLMKYDNTFSNEKAEDF